MEDLEPVFRALADPHRRHLLDRLRERDGQTLGELEAALPQMTRFGVMKHLRVLEEAGLLTRHRDGRTKLHFLNPVPVQLIADRWISRFAAPWVTQMADLKHHLEAATPMAAPKQVFEIYIRAEPQRVWQAITDPAFTKQYYFGTAVESDLKPGSPFRYLTPDGNVMLDGKVIEADPPRRLVQSFIAKWSPEDAKLPPSRVTWEITPMGEATRLSLVHDEWPEGATLYEGVRAGWSQILSGMKTLLETGTPLKVELPEAVTA